MTSVIPPEADAHVQEWVRQERESYAVKKWEEDNADLQAQVIADGTWANFPSSYITRAMGAGLDTAYGRQQLGKVISTAMSLLGRAVDLYGEMPKPGTESGEVFVWLVRKGDCEHLTISIYTWEDPRPVCTRCGTPLDKVPTKGTIIRRAHPEAQPMPHDVIVTPDGMVGVEDGQVTRTSPAEEGDDDFHLEA